MNHFGRFLLVGGLTTALQFALMIGLINWAAVDPVTASAVGFIVSALVNYQLNRVVTFDSSQPHHRALPRFTIVATSGLCLNTVAMYGLVASLGLHFLAGQVVTTALVLVWNFALSKRWTFS